jgi:glycosyltransferase involved in cell wall biosynthesis
MSGRRIGFVSTRFAGTDGVSLETEKWADVLEGLGHACFYFAGRSDRPAAVSEVVPEAFFGHPEIEAINRAVFGAHAVDGRAGEDGTTPNEAPRIVRPAEISAAIESLRGHLRAALHRFVHRFEIELLIVENASAIPLNLPLGLAISDVVVETGLPTIAHHHDLPWERQRFLVNSVEDVIAAAFPPAHQAVRHVVINSLQARELAWRRGLTPRVIPNVMDFDRPPPPSRPERLASLRRDLGLSPGELLVLQPTRIVARKGIEHAIEFVRRLERPARLVISHAAGDEGDAYEGRVRAYADLLGVPLVLAAAWVAENGDPALVDGDRYSLAEFYAAADFVTYPSVFEGFGNAFLEAIYYRRPILVNNYSTYEVDLRPRGFRVVWFDEFIDEATIRQARRLLDDPATAAAWAERNYEVGRRHFSFTVLERHLAALLVECFGAAG